MHKLSTALLTSVIFLLHSGNLSATVFLVDWGFNIDSTTYCSDVGNGCDFSGEGNLSAEFEISNFDFNTGLGTVNTVINGIGNHSVLAFFDHEIDESMNGFINEFGISSNIPATGQTWEIDEPGFLFGDIFDNFFFSSYDASNNVPQGFEDDVALGLGWEFNLAIDEMANISFLLSTLMPTNGFYLAHVDADSGQTIYFNSTLDRQKISGNIPEPEVILLIGSGLLLMFRKLSIQ